MTIASAALDRHITGNYGEDQFKDAVTCNDSYVDEYLEGRDLDDDFANWISNETAGPQSAMLSYLRPGDWKPHLRPMIAAFRDAMREKYRNAAEEAAAASLAERSY